MPSLRSGFMLRFFAVMALLGAFWQTTAGQLEHLGIIPHVHVVVDFGADEKTPASAHGLMHHHHLPDVDLQAGLLAGRLVLPMGFIPEVGGMEPPEAPVFGIEYPPQLS